MDASYISAKQKYRASKTNIETNTCISEQNVEEEGPLKAATVKINDQIQKIHYKY